MVCAWFFLTLNLWTELIILLDGYFNAFDQFSIAESLPLATQWSLRLSRAPFSDFLLLLVRIMK
jgi:hypothetical protein